MILIFARIIAVVFALLVISKSFLSYKQRQESRTMFIFWSATWLMIVAVAAFPSLPDLILGRARVGVGTVLSVGLLFVYFVLYRVYTKAERNEQRLHALIRGLAVKDIETEDLDTDASRDTHK